MKNNDKKNMLITRKMMTLYNFWNKNIMFKKK